MFSPSAVFGNLLHTEETWEACVSRTEHASLGCCSVESGRRAWTRLFYKNKSAPTQCNGVRQWEESVVIVVESIVQFVLRGLQFA